MFNPVVTAINIRKRLHDVLALDDVSLHVAPGEVLGLLGPNGAGKTTLVKVLTTLLPLDGGSAQVAGYDVRVAPREVRRRIGLAGQSAAVDEKLTARENLELFGRLYQLSRRTRTTRTAELIDQFDLHEFANRPGATYSGGQRRRLDIAVALVASPPVLFLDEPTVGLDARSRRAVWDAVRELASAGTAIILTTQYLEEADQLADRIVVIDHGLRVAEGTPAELKKKLGHDVLEIRLETDADVAAASEALKGANVDDVWSRDHVMEVPMFSGARRPLDVLRVIDQAHANVRDFQLRRPSLDDVFLSLTAGSAVHDQSEIVG